MCASLDPRPPATNRHRPKIPDYAATAKPSPDDCRADDRRNSSSPYGLPHYRRQQHPGRAFAKPRSQRRSKTDDPCHTEYIRSTLPRNWRYGSRSGLLRRYG